jgi:hypothetical protein
VYGAGEAEDSRAEGVVLWGEGNPASSVIIRVCCAAEMLGAAHVGHHVALRHKVALPFQNVTCTLHCCNPLQLPMYNEDVHCERVIRCACNIAWPRDKLLIQVREEVHIPQKPYQLHGTVHMNYLHPAPAPGTCLA